MASTGRFRRAISTFLLWSIFFCLYAGGTAVLALGLIFTLNRWGASLHPPARAWPILLATCEVLLTAAGLLLVLIVPFLQFGSLEKLRRQKQAKVADFRNSAPPPA